MIDTDKYTGHTEGPWLLAIWESGERVSADKEKDPTYCYNYEVVDEEDNVIASIEEPGGGLYADSNANLLADAPLLLEAYKRLRLVADELYLHIVGEPHMTLDELVAEMPWRDVE